MWLVIILLAIVLHFSSLLGIDTSAMRNHFVVTKHKLEFQFPTRVNTSAMIGDG